MQVTCSTKCVSPNNTRHFRLYESRTLQSRRFVQIKTALYVKQGCFSNRPITLDGISTIRFSITRPVIPCLRAIESFFPYQPTVLSPTTTGKLSKSTIFSEKNRYSMQNDEKEKSGWQVTDSEYLFRRPWLTVRRDRLRLPNGQRDPRILCPRISGLGECAGRYDRSEVRFRTSIPHGLA